MKAFVTGATGFIGGRLVERLLVEGVEVVALMRGAVERLPEGVRAVPGDVTRPESLADLGRGCDRLYHLAALISFDRRRLGDLMLVNGRGTAHILQAARRWGIERSVVVSSACTLGLSRSLLTTLDESAIPAPKLVAANPYMRSKLATEREAATAASGGQAVVTVNPTTVYGPGDRSLNSGTLVVRVARSPALPVPPGGSNVVDVDDVVEGILAAGERGASGGRYVLGGGNLPFAEILATITEVVGRRPLLVPVPRWTRGLFATAAQVGGGLAGGRFMTPQIVGDLFDFKYYSSEKAWRESGWSPQYSFRQSVERAWDYYRREGLI